MSASNDPGLHDFAAPKPHAPTLDEIKKDDLANSMTDNVIEKDDDDQPIAPDQFDDKYQTTRQEIWAYYACVSSLMMICSIG
jgi:hypothetical protein